jgi:hypothetical protein
LAQVETLLIRAIAMNWRVKLAIPLIKAHSFSTGTPEPRRWR